MKFWVVIIILFVCGMLWLGSPEADHIRSQEVELRPVAQAVQDTTGASDLMSGILPLVALGAGVCLLVSRAGGGPRVSGGMSDDAQKFIATCIACIVLALLLG